MEIQSEEKQLDFHGAPDVALTFSRRMKTIDTIRLSRSGRQDIRIILRSLIIVRVCI